jgi:hypothetical protein
VQGAANIVAVKLSPKPVNLVRRPKERVITIDGRVLALYDILDFADRVAGYISNTLEMLWNE